VEPGFSYVDTGWCGYILVVICNLLELIKYICRESEEGVVSGCLESSDIVIEDEVELLTVQYKLVPPCQVI